MTENKNINCGVSSKIFIIPAFVSAFVIIDQFTKRLIESSFVLGERLPVIAGYFDLTYIKNRGSAFGMFSQIDSVWIQRGFTVFTVIALIIIVTLYRSMASEDRMGKVALVMIGTGALGNLADRIRDGAVTDFLLFYVGDHYWPAFNVADSLITTGVVILSYALIFLGAGSDKDSSGSDSQK
ncbi:MAG TPA: signal peptidase II [Nitrospirae bacterium]|nr:signal peptidase II [Nitrospirota bacterium]